MKKISHKIPFRRTLAIICAATIAMLQCAVLLAVEPVHGETNLNVTVECKIGSGSESTSKPFTKGDLSPLIPIPGTEYQGISIKDVYGKTGISEGYSSISGADEDDLWCPDTGKIYASDGTEKSSNTNITYVINDYIPIKSISLATAPSSMKKGDPDKDFSKYITYTAEDDFFSSEINKYGKFIELTSWDSTNKKVATVTDEGVVKIVSSGSTTITVSGSAAGKSFNCTKPITGTTNPTQPTKPTKINIGNNSITIKVPEGKYKKGDKPKPVVTRNGKTLAEGTDYWLGKYNYNSSKGTGSIVVHGKGKYDGQKTVYYAIAKETKKKEEKKENKEIKRGDVTIKVKRGEKIKTNDSPSEIKKKLSVSVDNVPSPLKDSQWDLIEYDKNKDEATIRTKIDGYANLEVTKKVKTSRYYSNNNNNNNNSGRTFTFRRPSNASSSPSTGTTVPNVTYAPDRTITVKEVYLGEKIEDEPQTDPMDGTMTEPMDGTESTDYSDAMDVETPPLQFGPAAGSVAVAAAAAGAGAVGRIRRFKLDTATEAVEQVTNSEE